MAISGLKNFVDHSVDSNREQSVVQQKDRSSITYVVINILVLIAAITCIGVGIAALSGASSLAIVSTKEAVGCILLGVVGGLTLAWRECRT